MIKMTDEQDTMGHGLRSGIILKFEVVLEAHRPAPQAYSMLPDNRYVESDHGGNCRHYDG